MHMGMKTHIRARKVLVEISAQSHMRRTKQTRASWCHLQSCWFPLIRRRSRRPQDYKRCFSWRGRRHRRSNGHRAWRQPGAERSWRRRSRSETRRSPAVSCSKVRGKGKISRARRLRFRRTPEAYLGVPWPAPLILTRIWVKKERIALFRPVNQGETRAKQCNVFSLCL